MSISVIIIAHNEEKNIGKCLTSLMNQSRKPDEIILVAHNCTDSTVAIAEKFPITIAPLIGQPGIANARCHGISMAKYEKILCIDGDAYASEDWIESLDKSLDTSKAMAACTRVIYTGNMFMSIVEPIGHIMSRLSRNKTNFFCGPSFGFTYKIKDLVLKTLGEFKVINEELSLYFYPDDFWLALTIDAVSPIVLTTKSKVWAVNKQRSFWEAFDRGIKSLRNYRIMKKYFTGRNAVKGK